MGDVVEYGKREDGFGCVGVESMGEGWRVEKSGGGVGEKGKAKVGEEGWRLPLAPRRLGNFDLRFFLADVLEMSCLVKCWPGELKG